MAKLKIKKLVPQAVLPSFQTSGAAAIDLTATSFEIREVPGNFENGNDKSNYDYVYGTGIAVEIPEGHVGLIFPRSSIFKTGMTLSNCVGVIDSDYRGEIKFIFKMLSKKDRRKYEVGDRLGQLMLLKLPKVEIEEVTELSDTARGTGGFGSTGK